MKGTSVEEYLYRHAIETPDKTAVIAGETSVGYGQLAELAKGYASFLRSKGLTKGDIVVVRSSQTLDFVVVYLAVHTAGGIIAPTEKNIPTEGIANIIKAIGAKFVISSEGEALPCKDVISIDIANVMTDAKQEEIAEFPPIDADDSADILFTTGTTGKSKGVEISHKALVATAENVIAACRYKKDTVVVVPGPLNHAGPIRKVVTTIVNGSAICLLNGMTDIKRFYDALDSISFPIGCCLPPSSIRTLFVLTGDKLGSYSEKIDFIESASAPLPEPDKLRLCKLLPNTRLYNNYGTSESASLCMYDYNANPGKIGCIGKMTMHSQILIVNDFHEVIQSSKANMGYLACAGDTNMKGYVNAPELTEQVMKDGIVYTNDVGYIDEDGYVYIVGRADDVINVGGLKVAPAEVEEAALSIDGIEDCICIAIPHQISGQALKLLVVMRGDVKFAPKEISSALQNKLEGYKVPVKYEQVDKIARTYNGKLDRKAYRV